MSVIKPKLWPITKDTDNSVNQSKLEANTCSQQEAQENVQVMIGFGFTSDCFFMSITEHSNAKPKQVYVNYF